MTRFKRLDGRGTDQLRPVTIKPGFVRQADKKLAGKKLIAKSCLCGQVTAVSVGMLQGKTLLDLNYQEDSQAQVDMNVAMTGKGQLIDIQASGEGGFYSIDNLMQMLDLAKHGVRKLGQIQREAVG